MITREDTKKIQERLEEEKKDLLKKIEEHEKTPDFGDEGHVEDFESGKADEAEEFSNNLSIAQAFRDRLEEVENALNRIKEEQYGICEACGKIIPEKDLLQQPTRTFCSECG